MSFRTSWKKPVSSNERHILMLALIWLQIKTSCDCIWQLLHVWYAHVCVQLWGQLYSDPLLQHCAINHKVTMRLWDRTKHQTWSVEMIFHFSLFLPRYSPDTHYNPLQLPNALPWQLLVCVHLVFGDETGTTHPYHLGYRHFQSFTLNYIWWETACVAAGTCFTEKEWKRKCGWCVNTFWPNPDSLLALHAGVRVSHFVLAVRGRAT